MTAPTTAPATTTATLGAAVDVEGTFPLVRSAREVAADIAVVAGPPLTALTAWAAVGSPVALAVAGIVAAGVAMAVECTRRHV